ncbi:MAG: leucine-rich repeat protein [Clostridia bacterium]|nr:leucine-rich repeat protein [Clostridia bacterium]
MKKLLSFLLITAMVLALIPFSAFSVFAIDETVTDEQGVIYTLSENGTYYIVTGCDSEIESVVVPETVNGIPVTTVHEWAFDDVFVETITLSKNIVSFEARSNYYSCNFLREINVPEENEYYCSENGILFNKDKTEIIVYPPHKEGDEYSIPETVTVIGDCAFYGSNLKSVIIPNGVVEIEDGAFSECGLLETIFIPESVVSIGGTFSGYIPLSSIKVDENNPNYSSQDGVLFNKSKTVLIQYPAGKDTSLYEVPESVEVIDAGAFGLCNGIDNIIIPGNVKSIGRSAFYACNFDSVVMEEGVETISDNAFCCCSFDSISLPNTLTYIGEWAFDCIGRDECGAPSDIVIPSSVTYIGRCAFGSWNESLTIYCEAESQPSGWNSSWNSGCEANIVWGYKSTDTPNQSEVLVSQGKTYETSPLYRQGGREDNWGYNENMPISYPDENDITLTDGIISEKYPTQTYGYYDPVWVGFHGKTPAAESLGYNYITLDLGKEYDLTRLSIFVGTMALGADGGLSVPDGVDFLVSADGETFEKLGETVITEESEWESYKEIVKKCSVKARYVQYRIYSEARWAFVCEVKAFALIDVAKSVLGYTLSEDGTYYIVSSCDDDAKHVVIPKSYYGLPVKEIGSEPFNCHPNLESVIIPDGITTIGDWAFSSCGTLEELFLPESLTLIGWGALHCEGLKSITVHENNTKYSSLDGVLFDKSKTKLIQYPIGKTDSQYVIPDSVTRVGIQAFQSCQSLTSVEIPNSVTHIDIAAFSGCTSLESIVIPDSIIYIGENAFGYCSELASITVDENNQYYSSADGVLFDKEKNELIFYPCGKTDAQFVVPDSVTSIGEWAFSGCTSLEIIEIPNSVTSIGFWVFEGWTSEQTIYCEAESQPSTWDIDWNAGCDANIVWGHGADTHEHSYDAIVIAPDCENGGYTVYTCLICGDGYESDFVAALGHSANEANCTEDSVCSRCGEIMESAYGHLFEGNIDYVDATCETGGYYVFECVICDHREFDYDEGAPAFGHTEGDWITVKEADVGVEGLKEKHCTVCDKLLYSEPIKALTDPCGTPNDNPAFDAIVDMPANYTPGEFFEVNVYIENISIDELCNVSFDFYYDFTKVELVNEINWDGSIDCITSVPGKDWENLTVFKKDETDVVRVVVLTAEGSSFAEEDASVCLNFLFKAKESAVGDVACYVSNVWGHGISWSDPLTKVPANGSIAYSNYHLHNYVLYKFDSDFHVYACECGNEYEEAHDFEIEVIKPDCKNGGHSIKTCRVCGEVVITDHTDALGHEEGEWITVKEPEMGVDGLREKYCTRCGTLLDSEILKAYVKGDVNGNGGIDAQDYALAKRHCLKTFTLSDEMVMRADLNGNGTLEASEYALIKRHVLGTFVIK